MSKKALKLKVPNQSDWIGYEKDLDLQDFYRLVYGKQVEDIYYYFKEGAYISRSDELLYSNRNIFQYYIYAFALYLETIGKYDIDAQDGFLRLLLNREEKDPGSVCQIYHNQYNIQIVDEDFDKKSITLSLESTVRNIENRLDKGVIDREIYSDFPELINNVKKLC